MTNSKLRLEIALKGARVARGPGDRRGAPAFVLAAVLLAALAALAAFAGLFLLHARSPAPSFVDRALGPQDSSFRSSRRWDGLTKVDVTPAGFRIAHAGHTVGLTASGAGAAAWTPHTWGVERATPFGRETIISAAPRAEELLTVTRHLGTRTWRWRLDTTNARPEVEADGSIVFHGANVRILPVAIYDRHGRDVTPAGARFGVEGSDASASLTLRLDDTSLPTPYTIDPIAVVASASGSSNTTNPTTVTKPAGTSTGNLMIASFALRNTTAAVSPPAGWTAVATAGPSPTAAADTIDYLYYKVATASEPASYQWSWSGGGSATDATAVIVSYSGTWTTPGSPIEASTVTSGATGAAAATAAGTNTFNNSEIALVYSFGGKYASAPAITGFTMRQNPNSGTGAPSSRSVSLYYDGAQATAGTIASRSAGSPGMDWTAAMLSIKPVSGTPTAANATVTASPTSVTADGVSTSTVTATFRDAAGNPVPNKTITLTAGSGSSTITTVSGTTSAAGQATFTVKDSVAQAVTYTAKDTTDTVTATQKPTVTFVAGPASAATSTVSASPASVTANGVATSTVTVTLKDANNNLASGRTVTLAGAPAGSTISPASAVTSAAGVATFTVKSTAAGASVYTATDSTDAVTVTQTASVTYTAGPVTAAQSTVSASPASVVADGVTTSTVTVTLRDANANVVAGKTVTLAKSGGSSTITTVTGTTNASGQATFTVKDSTVESTTYTATDTSDGVTVTSTATVAFAAGTPTAAQSTVSASPASVVANGAATSTVTVTLKDAQSHVVAGKTVTLAGAPSGSTISPASAATNASGIATFTVSSTAAGAVAYTATDSTDTVTVAQTATVTYTAGPVTAAQSTVSASPSAIPADGATTATVTVTLKDANANSVSGKTVTLAGAPAGSTISPASVATNGSGVATFTVKSTTAGTVTYTATDTSDTVTVTQTGSVTFNAGAVNSAQSTVSASPATLVADGAAASTVTVTAKDAFGNPVAGQSVSLAGSPGGSTITPVSGTTNSSGVATFSVKGTVAGTYTYTATIGITTVVQTAAVTLTAGAPTAAQSTVSASPLSVTADGATSSTVTVTLRDANANVVSGKTVTLAGAPAGSTVSPASAATNASGVAAFTVKRTTAGPVAYTATDTTDSVTVTQNATVTFTAGTPTAAQSAVTASPTSVTADGATTSTVTVTLRDANANVVAGKAVTLGGVPAGSTISPASAVTSVSGVATFTARSSSAGTVTYTATDTTDTVTVAQSATVTFTPGTPSAAQSTVTASPTSVADDGVATSTVTVTLKDASGNLVAGKSVALAGAPAGSAVSPASAATNASGVATFTVSSSVAGSVTYTATDTTDAVTVAQTAAVTYTTGPVSTAQSTVSASPSSVTADGAATSTITVTLKDATANPVSGKTVTLGGAPAGSTISPVSAATNGAGVATFTAKSSTAGTVTYTATDATDAVVLAQTAGVTFVAGAVSATQTTVTAAPTSRAADGASASTVTVTARDAFGNPVPGQSVALAGAPAGSTVATLSGTTNTGGVATFTVTSTAAGSFDYTASVGATAILQAATVQFTPGAPTPAQSTVTASPGTVTADGSSASAVSVTLRDVHGNPVPGKTVSLAGAPGGSSVSPASTVTDAAGVASFSVASTSAGSVTYTATDTTDGMTVTQTASVAYVPGPVSAGHSSVAASPSSVVADGTAASTVTVTLRDAHDNPVPGKTVSVSKAAGSSAVAAISATTDAAGHATFSVTDTVAETSAYSATDLSDALTVSGSALVDFAAGPATHFAVGGPASRTAGSSFFVGVTALDAHGNVAVGYTGTVHLTSSDPLAAVGVDAALAAGTGTFAMTLRTAGVQTVTATDTVAASLTGSAGVTVAPAAAASLVVTTASSTTAGAPQTVNVTAEDAFGNIATGYTGTVHLTSTDAQATLGADAPLTSGSASFSATLATAGAQTVTATDTVLTSLTGTTGAVAVGAAAPAKLAFGQQPTDVTAGAAIAPAPTVRILDAYGNPTSSSAIVSIAIAAGTGDPAATLAGTAAHAASSGVATFGGLSVDKRAGGYRLAATASGLAGATSTTFAVDAAAPVAGHSSLGAAPGSIVADGVATASVTVTARDLFDNPVASGGATVTLASDTGSLSPVTDNHDGTYTATLTSPTAAGLAHVTGTLDGQALPGTAVSLIAGPATGAHSAIMVAPAALPADGTSTATVTVHAKDAYDNAVATGGDAVLLFSDRGAISSVTDLNDGTYTATLTAATAAGTAHLTGTIDGQPLPASSVTLVPGAPDAANSTVVAASGVSSADDGHDVTVTVTARDAHGNIVPNTHVLLAQGATSSAISPALGTDTAADGTAVFTVSDSTAETAVYSATVGGTLVDQTASVQFQPGAPVSLAFGQQPTDAPAGATVSPAVTVRVLDAHGNLTTSSAAIGLSLGGATLGGTTTVAAAGGVATFSTLFVTRAGAGYTLSAASAGLTGATSSAFDVAAGAPSAAHTTLTAAPSSVNADGTSGPVTVTLQVKDAFDNAVTSGGNAVAFSTDLGSVSSATDNHDGTYTAALTATGTPGTAHLGATLDSVTIGGTGTVTFVPALPLVAIDSGVGAAAIPSGAATFAFHSTNAGLDPHLGFACSIDGSAFTVCTSPKTYSGLPDGAHTFRVLGVNDNGMGPDASESWTSDTVAPTVSLTTAPAAFTNAPSEPLAASAADATTSVASVDFRYGTSVANCPAGTLVSVDTTAPFSASWTLPADGSYVVCAIATDAVGNVSAAATSPVVVDRTKPTVSLSAFGTVVGSSAYVRGTAALHALATDATAGVGRVDFAIAPGTPSAVGHVTSAPYDADWDTTPLADGQYAVTATATDEAGNSDSASRTVVVDNTAPSASLDDPGAFGHGTIPLSVTASDAGSGVDAASTVVQSSPHGAGTWTTIAAPASWTPADGTYDLRALVPDEVGNETTTATRTILVDNTPPTVANDADAAWHAASLTVTLAATDSQSGVAVPAGVSYRIDSGSWTTGTSIAVPAPADGSNDGDHTITYHAVNRAGVASPDVTAHVKIDHTAPSSVTLDHPVAGAPLRGTLPASNLDATATDGTSGIASTVFRLAPSGSLAANPCTTYGTTVTAPFDTTSVPDGHYDVWVAATDLAGNTRCSVVPHDVVIDNTAPSTTDDAPAGPQNHDVTVTLGATDTVSGVAATSFSLDNGATWSLGSTVTILASSGDGVKTILYYSVDNAGNVETQHSTQVTIDTTAPSGNVTDPGSVLHGTVQLTASPTDPDVASVEFLFRPAGGSGPYTSIGTATSAPYQQPWITTGVPDGIYDVQIRTTDTSGNVDVDQLSPKTIDNTAPDSASVSAPAANADVHGTISLAALAHDATAGVGGVTFQVQASGDSGWTTVDADSSAPFTGSFDTTGKPDGPAQVRVGVTDVAGNGPLYSAPVAFTIDNTSPTVSLSVPPSVSGTTTVSAIGSADVQSVQFEASPHGAGTWTSIGTAAGAPYTSSWATGSVGDGLYDVRATATDRGLNTGTDVATVRVDNTAPAVTLTSPSGGTVGGSSVALTATAADAGAGVASVEFQYQSGGALSPFTTITTATGAPYGGTWDVTGLPSGSYGVRAVATDGAGNSHASPVQVVTVDSTPPSITAFAVAPVLSGSVSLHVTASVDTATVAYAVSPSGASTWSTVGSSAASPTFPGSFASDTRADGVYDLRATAVDAFGNSASVTVANVRIDNTPPALLSSAPDDGSVVASASQIDVTASEPLASVAMVALDGTAAAFTPVVSGSSVSFPTGVLPPGDHALTGDLVDLAGLSHPFRINLTVDTGGRPPTSRNVSNSVPTTLASVDNTATVTVPPNVWQQAVPTANDWLVLRIDPDPAGTLPPSASGALSNVVDVRMFWNLSGTEEHQFDAPLEIDLVDSRGFGIPVTAQSGVWRAIPALATAGSLPSGQQDGYWRDHDVVRILTRHLSVFALLYGAAGGQIAPPIDFAGVVDTDGLTLRWAPGMPNEQIANFFLYADGARIGSFGQREFEAKLGSITAGDDRRFTITESIFDGTESTPSNALRVVPAVAGLTVPQARRALEHRAFVPGREIPTPAPLLPAGTVVGPTDVRLLPEGSTVDLQVATPTIARSPFAFSVARVPRIANTARLTLHGRPLLTARARVDVTLDGKPFVRIQRWHFLHVKPGASDLSLVVSRSLRPGAYRLYWKATSEADGTIRRTVTHVNIVAPKARP